MPQGDKSSYTDKQKTSMFDWLEADDRASFKNKAA